MDFHWMYPNKSLLVALASAVALDGVLTILVLHQPHDHSTVTGQLTVGTAPLIPAASVSAGGGMVATPNAASRPDPATTPNPPNASIGSAAPAPGSATPQPTTTPLSQALVVSAPQAVMPAQQAQTPRKPLQPKIVRHRRIDPAPVPPPVPAAPQSNPATPATPMKPGAPPGF